MGSHHTSGALKAAHAAEVAALQQELDELRAKLDEAQHAVEVRVCVCSCVCVCVCACVCVCPCKCLACHLLCDMFPHPSVPHPACAAKREKSELCV